MIIDKQCLFLRQVKRCSSNAQGEIAQEFIQEVQRIIEQHVAVAQLWWKKCKCQQLSRNNTKGNYDVSKIQQVSNK